MLEQAGKGRTLEPNQRYQREGPLSPDMDAVPGYCIVLLLLSFSRVVKNPKILVFG